MAVVSVLGACSDTRAERASLPPATTDPPTTTSSSTSSTTIPPSTTTVAVRPTTTVAASSPEGHARTLFDAWAAGDRASAERVARAEAVDALFARRWQAADGWAFAECSGAAGSVICEWRRPAGQQLLFRVQTVTGGGPVTVSEVRFQP